MATINVYPNKLKQYSQNQEDICKQLKGISSRIDTVIHQLNIENESINLVKKSLQKDSTSIIKIQQNVHSMSVGLNQISNAYINAENYALGKKSSVGAIPSPSSSVTSSWNDLLKKQTGKVVQTIKTGAAKTVKNVKNTVASWIDDYKNKGVTWKVIKTGGAIISTVGAISSAAIAWGITAGSAGIGTPLASIVTLHASNTMANNFADLYNIWFGDTTMVGEINCLKAIDQAVLGERLGGAAYSIGSIASVVGSLSAVYGKVVQAPDMANAIKGLGSDLKQGISGITGLAGDVLTGKAQLSSVGMEINLLMRDLDNIKDITKCVTILSSVAGTTKKISTGVGNAICSIIDPGSSVESKSLTDLLFGGNENLSTANEMYSGSKDIYDFVKGFNDKLKPYKEAIDLDIIQYGRIN